MHDYTDPGLHGSLTEATYRGEPNYTLVIIIAIIVVFWFVKVMKNNE